MELEIESKDPFNGVNSLLWPTCIVAILHFVSYTLLLITVHAKRAVIAADRLAIRETGAGSTTLLLPLLVRLAVLYLSIP